MDARVESPCNPQDPCHAVRRLALAGLLLVGCGSAAPKPAALDPDTRAASSKPAASKVEGSPEIDPAQIVLGLRGHEAELHECFQLGGADDPAFVQLSWQVTPDGAVEQVGVVRTAVVSDSVAPCLSERLTEARFGRPGRKLQAHWTFVGGLVRFEDAETRKRNRANQKRKRPKNDEREEGIVIERSSPGKLDPGAVEGIVQNGYKLFAHCYRDGLSRDPKLGGAVRLRFVIGSDGKVARVIDGGSDLPDPGVVVCVAESFFALRFPKPDGGNVHLRYRIHFDSG